MALPTASDNPFPSLLVTETAAASISSPAAGKQRLFVDTDHVLKYKNSSGTVSNISTGGGSGIPVDGWIDDTAETWTFASATTFTVATDLTAKYTPGTRLKLTQTTVKYFVVVSSSYSAPNTTVTITAGTSYTFANAAVSANYHSYVLNPQGWPGWFNFAGAATGFSSKTTEMYRFAVNGRVVYIECLVNGTSNATTFGITAPIALATQPDGGARTFGPVSVTDNSGTIAAAGRAFIASGSTAITVNKDFAGAAFTASNQKAANFSGFYEM